MKIEGWQIYFWTLASACILGEAIARIILVLIGTFKRNKRDE